MSTLYFTGFVSLPRDIVSSGLKNVLLLRIQWALLSLQAIITTADDKQHVTPLQCIHDVDLWDGNDAAISIVIGVYRYFHLAGTYKV